ncbi:MAG: Glutamyl-tRNA(Gln) amidotransferase subunit A [Microgenomates group bacterium GW2011_GWC1_43_11]|nr:MAG: Glutamyl-tRNA(Gln) amidotransferase subunit A [Microgenomates group bacterium GW2011_GWC1_43_11]
MLPPHTKDFLKYRLFLKNNMDILNSTLKDAVHALRTKQYTSCELAQTCLDTIKKFDKQLHVFLTVNEENVLKEAKTADSLLAKGVEKPLLGIPIALKDLYSTENLLTTAGSKIIDNYVPAYDATVVGKYKKAGAIIIGKTNEDAWGHGSSGENSDYEPTRNPYDTSRVPGGSSSGSAVAVATGMCMASTGTDTGSSVRLPAAYCNLVGIKPTYGRVSRYGIIPMASSFDTIGHMTKTVYDNAYLYEITAGYDPKDATSVDIPVPKYTSFVGKDIKGIKIGIPKEYVQAPGMQKEVRKLTENAIKDLESLGAIIKEVSLPHTDVAMACYYILVPSEISSNLARFDGVRFGHLRDQFGAEAKRRIMLGTHALSAGYYDAFYKKAAQVRTLIKQDFENVFQDTDALVMPSSPTVPFKLGEKVSDPLSMYLSDIFVCPVNIAGIPGLSIPCGFADHLPVGLQIVGPQFSEERLYQIAYAYEQIHEWYREIPSLLKR